MRRVQRPIQSFPYICRGKALLAPSEDASVGWVYSKSNILSREPVVRNGCFLPGEVTNLAGVLKLQETGVFHAGGARADRGRKKQHLCTHTHTSADLDTIFIRVRMTSRVAPLSSPMVCTSSTRTRATVPTWWCMWLVLSDRVSSRFSRRLTCGHYASGELQEQHVD